MNALLDDLYDEVVFDYVMYQNALEDVRNKIKVILKTRCEGSNEQIRTATAYRAACNYKEVDEDGNEVTVDLFELESSLRWKASFLEAVIKVIQHKADRLLSDLTVLKLESQVLGG